MPETAIIYSDTYLKHDTGGHVENVNRLRSIKKELENAPFAGALEWISPREATLEEIGLIHEQGYVASVKNACSRVSGISYLNPDTAISAESYDVALLAAGGVLTGVEKALNGEISSFFAAVRPPGHHAEYDESLGFCLFNNIAIGARYAIETMGLDRVMIFDWDVHHGNGTQHSLYSDPTVFFSSFHQFPHYPGTGRHTDFGHAAGNGYTLNFPMRSGSGDADYIHLIKKILVPVIKKYEPQLLLVSAGFDAHEDDPLSGIMLTSGCYGHMTKILMEAAQCPIGLVLEGGYNLRALADSVASAVGSLVGEKAETINGTPSRFALELEEFMISEHPFLKNENGE